MEDKEVGELWSLVTTNFAENFGDHGADVVDLIRKLVEERAMYIALEQHQPGILFVLEALKHFGIDPEAFK